jgi:hypothetical protein
MAIAVSHAAAGRSPSIRASVALSPLISSGPTPAQTESMRLALQQALKDYSELAQMEVDTRDACRESGQYYGTAADNILQQIKVVDERNLDSAVHYLERMAFDDQIGSEAILLDYVDYADRCADDALDGMVEKITQSRIEFRKSRNSVELIEDAMKTDYEHLKGTYKALLKDVNKRAEHNDKQWIKFEEECRQWQLSKMNEIVSKYRRPEHGVNNLAQKYKVIRKRVNKRLSGFSAALIDSAKARLAEPGSDYNTRYHKAVHRAIEWKHEEQQKLEDWLSVSIADIEMQHMDLVDKLQGLLVDLRQHEYSLELYKMKIEQLGHLFRSVPPSILPAQINKRKYYSSILSGAAPSGAPDVLPSYGTESRDPLSAIPLAFESYSGIKYPPWSPALGTRMFELARRTGVSADEFAIQLQSLLYDITDSDAILEKLGDILAIYNQKNGV